MQKDLSIVFKIVREKQQVMVVICPTMVKYHTSTTRGTPASEIMSPVTEKEAKTSGIHLSPVYGLT